VKKIIFIMILCLPLMGCSLIPRLTFNTPNTVPQNTQKSNLKESCEGEFKVDTEGNIISCSKGYHKQTNNYSQKERSYTFQERIANIIRSLSGWFFWILVGLIILCPSLLGFVISRIFDSTRVAFTQTVSAIKTFRQKAEPAVKESLDNYLRASQDDKTKQIISQKRTEV